MEIDNNSAASLLESEIRSLKETLGRASEEIKLLKSELAEARWRTNLNTDLEVVTDADLFADCREGNHKECLYQWPPSKPETERLTCSCPCHSRQQVKKSTMNNSVKAGGEAELLPCPFCANTTPRNQMMRTGLKVKQDSIAYLEPSCWIVLCLDCGANGANHNTAENAVTAWNTRADTSASKANVQPTGEEIIGKYSHTNGELNEYSQPAGEPTWQRLHDLLNRYTLPCLGNCEHSHCPLLKELWLMMEEERIKEALDDAKKTVQPIVDADIEYVRTESQAITIKALAEALEKLRNYISSFPPLNPEFAEEEAELIAAADAALFQRR